MSAAASDLHGQRILIAEDESLIAFQLESTLASMGCEVVGPVASVEDVLRHAEQGGVDGALLDVNLRGQQIFDVLPRLIALDIPLIISSGYGDATSFPEAFRALPRVTKPFDDMALQQMCERVFAKR